MRVKSEIWVKAYLRRAMATGVFGAVLRHGDDEAGTIFIKVNRLNGTARLFGPAPSALAGDDGERRFSEVLPAKPSEADVDAHLQREQEFDGDLWVIEIERPDGDAMLDGWLTV